MKLPFTNLPPSLTSKLRLLNRYKLIIFIVFVVSLYAYSVLQINTAVSVQPADPDATVTQATAHVDPSVVNKITQLQDNSVSVQALFNQSRSNPFQQ